LLLAAKNEFIYLWKASSLLMESLIVFLLQLLKASSLLFKLIDEYVFSIREGIQATGVSGGNA